MTTGSDRQESEFDLRVMFYNVENLFDTENDPLTEDDEFTPEGTRRWNNSKYYSKLYRISKVIIAAGGWEAPDIVGLCEVENRKVLEDLVYRTPLEHAGYRIVHYEGGDRRGIDVALLYRPQHLELIFQKPVRVEFRDDTVYISRDILYTALGFEGKDTLHLFVNHWPSKYGGVLETAPRRVDAALCLKKEIDSICSNNRDAAILAMGDLNDGPGSQALELLQKGKNGLMPLIHEEEKNTGTLKYQGEWFIYDHIMVSGKLFDTSSYPCIPGCRGRIFSEEFLLERDPHYPGKMPFRTFRGFRYNAGFSDHLPVTADIKF